MAQRMELARAETAVLLAPGVIALTAGFILPIVFILQYGFFDEASVPTFQFLHKFIADPFYRGVAWRTLKISAITTLACLALGFPLSYVMANSRPVVRNVLIVCVILPMMTSVVVRTFGWMVLLGRGGLVASTMSSLGFSLSSFTFIHTETGIILAMIQILLPLMTLTLLGVVNSIETDLSEAARSMGAGFYRTLRHVVFPLSMPGVIAGSLLVFSVSSSSFITPNLIGGPRLQVMGAAIYQQAMVTFNWQFAAAQSAVLLVSVLVLVAVAARLERRHG